MALRDRIGLTGPEYEVDIERGKIREFARAMSAPLPEFLSGRTPIIPAAFLVSSPYTWGYTLERPRGTVFEQIEHDLTVSLHAEESIEFCGPLPRGGDRLIAQGKLEDVRRKSGASGGELTFLVFSTQYRDETGNLRAKQRSTSVTTGQVPGSDNWTVNVPDYRPDYSALERPSPFSRIERTQWKHLAEGDSPGPVNAGPLLLQDIVRFQGVVGEDDPLHYDSAWANASNYPATFGLGTHQASLLAAYAAHWLTPGAVRQFTARFHDMSWPGDILIYNGTVTQKDEMLQTAGLHLTCSRDGGDVVTECWINYDFSEV